jgi:hypothetical protein
MLNRTISNWSPSSRPLCAIHSIHYHSPPYQLLSPQALPSSGVGIALFAFVEPTVPAIVPNPIVPAAGVAPRLQVPSAVEAKVCVKTTHDTLVTVPTVYKLPHVPTVGDCDAAKVVATLPAATACGSAVVKERRAMSGRRNWTWGCMAEFIGEAQVLAVAGCSCKPPGIGNMMAFFLSMLFGCCGV